MPLNISTTTNAMFVEIGPLIQEPPPPLGHEATDTGLAYAPVSQAHGHHHTQFNVLPCCTAAQTRSVPNVALRLPLQVAIESS